jgi:predicted ATP-dependent protease
VGYTRAIVPRANQNDILLEHRYRDRIEVVLADHLGDALQHCLQAPPKRVKPIAQALQSKRVTKVA